MNLNDELFEESEIERINTYLSNLIEKRKINDIEISNLQFKERYITIREKLARGKIFYSIFLSLLIGIILFVISIKTFNRLLQGISIAIPLIVFVIQIPRIIKMYKRTPKGLVSIYNLEHDAVKSHINLLYFNANKMDAEIADQRKVLEQLKSIEAKEIKENVSMDIENYENNISADEKSASGKLMLRLIEVDTIQKKEIRKELKSDIEKIRIKIEENYNKINELRHNVIEIDNRFNKMKKEIVICLVIVAVLECLSNFPVRGLSEALALCSMFIILFMTGIAIIKYRQIVFDYIFERNDKIFKDYAFRKELVSNTNKIKQLKSENDDLMKIIDENMKKIEKLRNK